MVVFAVIGEVVQPQRYSGIFGAAPSVALANLSLVAAGEGVTKARIESRGLIVGGVAMTVACALWVPAIQRLRALRGSAAMIAAWLAVAACGTWRCVGQRPRRGRNAAVRAGHAPAA